MTAAVAVTGPVTWVSKRELSKHLGCSKPTIDALIDRYPEFPIVARGSNGLAWRFDLAAVTAFLQARRAEEARTEAARNEQLAEQLAQLTLPGLGPEPEERGYSPREKKTEIEAELLRDKLARDRGELVPAAEVSAALKAAFALLGSRLEVIVPQVAADHHLPPVVTAALVARFEVARADLVRTLQTHLLSKAPADAPLA